MDDVYKAIKKQNGEGFARQMRDHHNGLFEIPGIEKLVRHAGRDAAPLLPYLMSQLSVNDDVKPPSSSQDPIALLDKAGYDAFYADTLEAQNSIRKYFAPRELWCTFNDASRYEKYHIVHAVKKDVDGIRREDFRGREERQDAYGTSVISIQMLKAGGFISIKNRYNHVVASCDNTFNSNPDNIVEGLSQALQDRLHVEFTASKSELPEGFVVMGDQIFRHHVERNNIYYGDGAFAENAVVHEVDKVAGDALFDGFLFDNASKTLKKIDAAALDSFADDFNRDYGGNRALTVHGGNLMLDGHVLIGAEGSRIKTLSLPALTKMGDYCLFYTTALTHFEAPALTTMGDSCLFYTSALTHFEAPVLTTMGDDCLYEPLALTYFEAGALRTMGSNCLYCASSLTHFEAPALVSVPRHLQHLVKRKAAGAAGPGCGGTR